MSRVKKGRHPVILAMLAVAVLAALVSATLGETGTGPTGEPRAIGMTSPTGGWVWHANALRSSKDAGATWRDITPPDLVTDRIRGIQFTDGQHGFVVATGPADADGKAALYVHHTSDGGTTWTANQVAPASWLFADAAAGPVYIEFRDDLNGTVNVQRASSANFSIGDVFTTADRGVTWTSAGTTVAGRTLFTSASDGVVVGGPGDHQLFATSDGGRVWQPRSLLPGASDYGQLVRLASGQIVVPVVPGAGRHATLMSSGDAKTWTTLASNVNAGENSGASPTIVPVGSAAASDGVAGIDETGGVTMVSNSGVTTKPVNSTSKVSRLFLEVAFGDAQHGWAIETSDVCDPMAATCIHNRSLVQTTDGGTSWSPLQ